MRWRRKQGLWWLAGYRQGCRCNTCNTLLTRPVVALALLHSCTLAFWQMADIAAISAIVKRAGVLLAVDNTFMSSYFQRPLELGADMAVNRWVGGCARRWKNYQGDGARAWHKAKQYCA